MRDFTKEVPDHVEKYIGENDLFLEIFEGKTSPKLRRTVPHCFLYMVPLQAAGCGANTFLTLPAKDGPAMS